MKIKTEIWQNRFESLVVMEFEDQKTLKPSNKRKKLTVEKIPYHKNKKKEINIIKKLTSSKDIHNSTKEMEEGNSSPN